MGIFDKLFSAKSKEIVIAAPVAGKVVPIREVSDPTFGQEILGKGVAIKPTGNRLVAPCDGKVEMMFDTGHAVSLTDENGAEILIHVGLETVSLGGKNFTPHVKNGDMVKKGQLLLEFDRDGIAQAGLDTITPIVICNSDQFSEVRTYAGKDVQEGEPVLGLIK